ncbi:flagellar protein FlgN [Acidithiobacillus sp. CV18-2]|uniref:Flagellar protein FlgN n=1 Tax=Igneacidithiobacillus copahuensis TaxID=2724909 RepID=A0AAE3CJ48_9PROT|nr:flagellar protein FlgN [Igneacidithiobacillus copahuensis]MBU2754414.1 flagellar protein FlgN [Acidithiobacillus sp. CV18-3]MBU2757563.1 flagellar protein FlgN [Acidithiobacillus sp. BN09-2]MBU2777122.1 flagellar protein FlgN [Acidithiobacillus sp. CV18-2]MBU2797435.1 flagellar protein FlgN [Acidithiobacillus sp. VAN18-2]MBU2799727.1 flagellar protein FlgN [Acidithiobacillus sp. VAN18-4]UTV81894.1 flagellar protein FlgN [Acidithiobacillus sp. YTS05]
MSSTAEIIALQIARLEALRQVLESESEALLHGDWAHVQGAAAQKLQLFREISALESQRRGQNGSPDELRHRQRLLQEIAQSNRRNGASIQALGRFQQEAWQVLFGTENKLYDDAGQIGKGNNGHRLGSA